MRLSVTFSAGDKYSSNSSSFVFFFRNSVKGLIPKIMNSNSVSYFK